MRATRSGEFYPECIKKMNKSITFKKESFESSKKEFAGDLDVVVDFSNFV